MPRDKVSVLIPLHNSALVISDAIKSAIEQDYPNVEVVISENGSSDNSASIALDWQGKSGIVTAYTDRNNIGFPKNLERLVEKATGEIVIFLCADDMFAHNKVISEIVERFELNPKVGHIGRWYYQYLDGIEGIVRIHRALNIYHLADNPSGLAFRKEAIKGVKVIDKPFVEAASMVKHVLSKGWEYDIIKKDAIAVRIHQGKNGSTTPAAYKYSPMESWLEVAGPQDWIIHPHFIGFIQLKNWGPYSLLWKEIRLTIKLRPANLLDPGFWLFGSIAVFTPRCILRPFTRFYKHRISRVFFDKFKL
jgi:glycosyltransferase involved in cell wall biosynthesis